MSDHMQMPKNFTILQHAKAVGGDLLLGHNLSRVWLNKKAMAGAVHRPDKYFKTYGATEVTIS